ncbi:MAG TPA: 16S rRNA (cytosine(1402)-N(4))-methyltransferase RsmH [Flavilitoribacter sp.]|nr:16S rRNA (cytosine(1402)-N(4))-methyltransferase RsmH [Flavilitoribacter sp.]HMQ90024.1 16S rRNA (cytosine(1402)-N(4))-methyltransferase RsmH [Flavilitoribacter sp.]
MAYHVPVLAKECMELLAIRPEGVYVDVTFGGGGHSRLILEKLGGKGRLIAFDQDEDVKANEILDPRFTLAQHNFRIFRRFLRLEGVDKVDGILADLGVSSHQLDVPERGFSHRFDEVLDMRMDQRSDRTAADLINTYDESQLLEVFSRYGEVRNSRSLAARLVAERSKRPLRSVNDLLQAIDPLIRGDRQRYLSQVFQALRIELNDEMGALRDFLEQSLDSLKPGARIVVISYHSLEDRMVKNFFRSGSVDGEIKQDFFGNIYRPFELLTKKAIAPGEEELRLNPRSRSAKLRAAVLAPSPAE